MKGIARQVKMFRTKYESCTVMRFHEDGTKIDVYRRMMKWWRRIVVLELSLGLKICKIADFLLESTAMYIVVS